MSQVITYQMSDNNIHVPGDNMSGVRW